LLSRGSRIGRSRPPAARTRGRSNAERLERATANRTIEWTADEETVQIARAFADCAGRIEEIVYSG
jgi:hypothetical protein